MSTPQTFRIADLPNNASLSKLWYYKPHEISWWRAGPFSRMWEVTHFCYSDERPSHDPTVLANPLPAESKAEAGDGALRAIIAKAINQCPIAEIDESDCVNVLMRAIAPLVRGADTGDVLRGRLTSAGYLTLLEAGEPVQVIGVFVKCTREALESLRGNMIYADVEVRAARKQTP